MRNGVNLGVYFSDGLCNNLALEINHQYGDRTTRFNP